ncbi:Copia protein [Ceratobasidium theobromae]|uniref:Copia protein n=1 Tax=Ceratobasidium theobromae TaxID=1582974 RepID=A0A5N5Q7S0_9AGAM|nr:Copia protein [Ceratobasidium theobromae]
MLDRKSITGNVFLLGGAAVCWMAKKQPTVALSTMEAKYIAIALACAQALWMRQFFEEIEFGTTEPTIIVSDNIAALSLTVESQYYAHSKHIDIKHHFVRDAVNNRKIIAIYIPTNENVANALTKALPSPRFYELFQTIMGKQIHESEEDYLWN